MSDDIKLEVQAEPGSKIQFGRTTDFRVAKPLNKNYLKIAIAGFLILAIGAVVIGPPEPPLENSSSPPLSTPDYVSTSDHSAAFDIEEYEERSSSSRKPGRVQSKASGLRGPESLVRNEKIFFEPGTTVKATVVSGGALGFVKAKLTESLKNTPLKAGSILIGKAESSDDRIQVHFIKAIVAGKESYALNAYVASPEDQEAGIAISLWEKYSRKFGMTAALYMVTGFADGLQSRESVGNQTVVKPTLGNAVLGGIKTSSFETANDILNDQKNKQPKPSLKNDLPVLVVFDGEIELAR